jgi:hypothetical protein
VFTADVRSREDVDGLMQWKPDRVLFTAAQASRPLSFEDPEYTESTNLVGPRSSPRRSPAPAASRWSTRARCTSTAAG